MVFGVIVTSFVHVYRRANRYKNKNKNNISPVAPSVPAPQPPGYGLCTICHDDISGDSVPLTLFFCSHAFHEKCWTDYKNSMGNPSVATCPNCGENV